MPCKQEVFLLIHDVCVGVGGNFSRMRHAIVLIDDEKEEEEKKAMVREHEEAFRDMVSRAAFVGARLLIRV